MKSKTALQNSLLVILLHLPLFAIPSPLNSPPHHFVVIGAFTIEKNAVRRVAEAKKLKFDAVYRLNTEYNLQYVYILKTEDLDAANAEANRIRSTTPFTDTWVYTGDLGAGTEGSQTKPSSESVAERSESKNLPSPPKPVPAEAKAEKMMESIEPEKGVSKPAESKPQSTPVSSKPAENEVKTSSVPSDSTRKEKKLLALPANLPAAGDAPAGSRNFVFRFMNALDSADLDGEVDIKDLERNTQVATFKANQNIVLKSFNKSGKLLLIGQAFGYRPVKLNLNFNKPEDTQDILVDGNRYVIPFNMTRLQKGDKEVMYNVYFFKDAGVMRPESRPEVNSLLEMMNQNLKYKIMIHGHTNGNKSGKIISMGDSKKFFSLEGTKQGYGSAKKLSEQRAKVIRDYLVANGVSPDRAEIKAWGGKKPIHDEDSAQARENVRVEIEILEDK